MFDSDSEIKQSIKYSAKPASLHKKQERRMGILDLPEEVLLMIFFVCSALQPRLLGPANMPGMEESVLSPKLVERSSLLQGVRRENNQGGVIFCF